jgi:hypothetical protein
MHGQGQADGRAVQVSGSQRMAGLPCAWRGRRSAKRFKAPELSAWHAVAGYGGVEKALKLPEPLLSIA